MIYMSSTVAYLWVRQLSFKYVIIFDKDATLVQSNKSKFTCNNVISLKQTWLEERSTSVAVQQALQSLKTSP